jgi:hypothetical protein
MQVQKDEDGTEYFYEKIYVPSGDRRTEYCLSLIRVEHSIRGESHKTYVGIKDILAKHYIIIKWPGVR